MSMIPVRCFTCNKVIAPLWSQFQQETQQGQPQAAILDRLGVVRTCCRAALICNLPLLDKQLRYENLR